MSGPRAAQSGQEQRRANRTPTRAARDQPKSCSRAAKSGQERPESSQEQPRVAREHPKSSPRQAQERPRSGPRAPKSRQEPARAPQEHPKSSPGAAKRSPCPRAARSGPRVLKIVFCFPWFQEAFARAIQQQPKSRTTCGDHMY